MEPTTVLVLVVVVIVIGAGVALWMRQRSLSRRMILHAPPPENQPKPPDYYQAGPPEDVAADREETKKSAEEKEADEPVMLSGKDLFRDEDAIPQPSPEPAVSAPSTSTAAPGGVVAPAKPEAVPTEDVRFTAFHPTQVAVDTWYTLLTYAHLDSALARVQADAARFKDEMGGAPREGHSGAPAKLARGTEITIVPTLDGVTFNPERITFKWVEDLHRAEFRFQAGKALAGTAGNGLVTIYVGPLIVATIKVPMLFEETGTLPPIDLKQMQQVTTTLYKQEQIFVSYSHTDTQVVLACRNAYQALGYDVLIDVDDLRAGQNWNQALMGMIDRADIFQLFWSERAAQSKYVRQEWEYALQKSTAKPEGFIRPVYWEKPMVAPPPELAPLHFAYLPLPILQEPDSAHH